MIMLPEREPAKFILNSVLIHIKIQSVGQKFYNIYTEVKRICPNFAVKDNLELSVIPSV
jgi:hypothetical protein